MNNHAVIPAFDFREMVMVADGRIVTTSLRVAEYFGKRHDNVIRAVKRLSIDCSNDFNQLNFEAVEYLDKKGEMRLMYNITKDGWMMLVMGFTGKAATAIKESYIAAFNWMAGQLQRRHMMGEEAMHQLAIKETRSKLKGTIGSRLMSDRKREIPLLRAEEERVRALSCPPLFDELTL
ncbi:Rha family transcriptional regulator [Dickeya fangzhongdai]|uniref:Rha family transcriptional regulator n=1 Tax=Dickeya fangzhongdai TaxID=1778540 RepID=UPI002B25D53F|nr:Rha family transcriptional regulator [Dickeya fangzhongdai]WOX99975.1 Rha family transcriptional regulator [Dickeya fangzhongdai]WOY04876.1 Rha family transcriptional regulator [Dickeya fangzhongdai]